MDTRIIAEENLLFLTIVGSHAYGMATENSDIDKKGFFFAPKEILISPFVNLEQVEQFKGEKDSVVYELQKWLKLTADCNPNMLELLWVDPKFILHTSPVYELLRENREAFLCSKVMHTFSGYAMSQLKRIKGHNKWISNPQPLRRPKEIDFVSVVWNQSNDKQWNKEVPLDAEAYDLGGNIYGLLFTANAQLLDEHEAIISQPVTELKASGWEGNFDIIIKLNKQLYNEHVDNWKHYWQWKYNRNEVRSELEEKYGYDTKHAMHLIRLLRMGREVLNGDGVRVLRPDWEELVGVRSGKWSYSEVVEYAEGLEKELQSLYKTTKLPFSIDVRKAEQLLLTSYEMCWKDSETGIRKM